jgi:hypothetical protein
MSLVAEGSVRPVAIAPKWPPHAILNARSISRRSTPFPTDQRLIDLQDCRADARDRRALLGYADPDGHG